MLHWYEWSINRFWDHQRDYSLSYVKPQNIRRAKRLSYPSVWLFTCIPPNKIHICLCACICTHLCMPLYEYVYAWKFCVCVFMHALIKLSQIRWCLRVLGWWQLFIWWKHKWWRILHANKYTYWEVLWWNNKFTKTIMKQKKYLGPATGSELERSHYRFVVNV